MQNQLHKFSVAPMMDWTDRHCRFFHRLITRDALLYTEMVTAEAVLHGKRDLLLGFSTDEQPVALQLGGSDPKKLADAAAIGAAFGYGEINLNVGCPSDRVQEGRFGACLMAEPELVGQCVRAMADVVNVPITVKCRIGIDDQDSERDFQRFIDVVADHGCRLFVVHARKAWLNGLSPKENREVPPLDYERVYRLKAARPDLTIVINGGVASIDAAVQHLNHVDGVMMGRAAYQTPWVLADVDARIFGDAAVNPRTRADVMADIANYADGHVARGGRLHAIARHVLGIYHGEPGARGFRRHLSERGVLPGATGDVLREATALVEAAIARREELSQVA
ncbi:MAG: tRNA dihydrouridine(20/20a) synthase DusA [Hyphomicrobiaceae bacterium]|nr:tRNA dihydrouridine(20/20a) synthase DusA [Hyphomicrobiaceae bacterium]